MQYYCNTEEKIILRHLVSVKLKACSSDNIFKAIVDTLEQHNIPWSNLISILMDSCNTMRGIKNGVEVQIRKHKAPLLLDIGGEVCHTVNNCAKKFTEPFLKYLESLCDSIYFDIKSADKREIFFELAILLNVKALKPLSRPDHRWLYVLVVLERIEYLWDVLILFYFSWLSKEESEIFNDDIKLISEKRNLTPVQLEKIKQIQFSLKKKSLTNEGKNRKQRIIQGLFEQRKKTLLQMGIYKTVLPTFNSYLKKFQEKNISLHLIHIELYKLTKQFLSYFIKHEAISTADKVEDLLKIDVGSTANQLPDNLIFTGVEVSKLIKNSKKSDVKVMEFKETLKTAYSKCAQYMLRKLPLKNSSFIRFTGLDPDLKGTTAAFSALIKLAESLPNVICEDEMTELDQEIRNYQVDSNIKISSSLNILADFWMPIFKMKQGNNFQYPLLSKLVKAVLTCFHGPHVESAFNLMGNIMTENRTSLNIESLDSVQTIKYYLLSKNNTTCEEFGSKEPMNEPIKRNFAENLLKSRAFYKQILENDNGSEHDSNISEVDLPCSSEAAPISPSKENTCARAHVFSQKRRTHSPEKNIKTKQTKIASFFKI